jgi:hypothetical protein
VPKIKMNSGNEIYSCAKKELHAKIKTTNLIPVVLGALT